LRLKEKGDIRGVQDHGGNVVKSQAEDTSGERNPVPVDSLDVDLDTDSVHNNCKGYTTAEPMGLTFTIIVRWAF
jgi:hypothetical protein